MKASFMVRVFGHWDRAGQQLHHGVHVLSAAAGQAFPDARLTTVMAVSAAASEDRPER